MSTAHETAHERHNLAIQAESLLSPRSKVRSPQQDHRSTQSTGDSARDGANTSVLPAGQPRTADATVGSAPPTRPPTPAEDDRPRILLQMPWDETAVVATDVLPDGCTLNDVKATVARLAEATTGKLDLILIAVPAGEGVAAETVLVRAMGLVPR